jgi:uncharacterized RDD family membrane protein YckC
MGGPPQGSWQAPPMEAGPAPGVRFAGYGARLIAYIIDGIVLAIVVSVVSIALLAILAAAAANDSATVAGLTAVVWILAVLIISLLYFPYFWANGGATPGMRLFHIRVVRDADGGPVGWGAAILRLIGYWINGLVLYLGYIWIFIDKRRRGWHDLIAGTVVIEG